MGLVAAMDHWIRNSNLDPGWDKGNKIYHSHDLVYVDGDSDNHPNNLINVCKFFPSKRVWNQLNGRIHLDKYQTWVGYSNH